MFACPLCLKSFKTATELDVHFQINDKCRGYTELLLLSKRFQIALNPKISPGVKIYFNKFSKEG